MFFLPDLGTCKMRNAKKTTNSKFDVVPLGASCFRQNIYRNPYSKPMCASGIKDFKRLNAEKHVSFVGKIA